MRENARLGRPDRAVTEKCGPELVAAGHRLVPRARIATWRLATGPGAGLSLSHVQPIAVDVTTPDGRRHSLPVQDVTAESLRAMAVAGVGVAVAAAALLAVLGRLGAPSSPLPRRRKDRDG